MKIANWISYACIFCVMMTTKVFSEESYLEPLITQCEIEQKIVEVAKVINQDYAGKKLVIVANLKGAIVLAADLMRELTCPFSLEFITCSSYGMRGVSRGELTITGLDAIHCEGKDVLVIDDIFDSGATMSTVVKKMQEKNPASVKSLVLLEKNTKRRAVDYRPDYVLFQIDDYFVVGYGLDYEEYFRGLKGVYNLVLDKMPKDQYALAWQ
jgi:hypoxanthine phosphoribosyltransferase